MCKFIFIPLVRRRLYLCKGHRPSDVLVARAVEEGPPWLALARQQGLVGQLVRGEVDLEEAVLIVEIFDATCHSISLVVAPVVVLGVDGSLPDVVDRPVPCDQLVVVVQVVENVVNVLL